MTNKNVNWINKTKTALFIRSVFGSKDINAMEGQISYLLSILAIPGALMVLPFTLLCDIAIYTMSSLR